MKIAVVVFLIFTGLLGSLFAQVVQEWEVRFNGWGNGIDWAHSITVDDFGNVYVTGQTMGNNGTDMDFATIKYNSTGAQEWVKRYNGPGNLTDMARFIALDDSGNVYVAGQSWGSGGSMYDYTIIKYTTSGSQKWVARYNGPGNEYDEVSSLALDDSGNVYVTGRSWGSGFNNYDYATIKYNSSGVQKWVARYEEFSWDEAVSLALDKLGNVYVTGIGRGFGTLTDYMTIKYNSFGIQQWLARYNGPENLHDEAVCIAVDDSSNVYVTGQSYATITYNDILTIKYNSTGEQQWLATYNGSENGNDTPNSLVLDDFGNVYVSGFSWGTDPNDDGLVTIKYNSDGGQEWLNRYVGPGNDIDRALSMAVDESLNVYVTGGSVGSGTGYDYVTIKYNSRGTQEWVQRYNGTGNSRDEAFSLALDVSGNVYVTGWSVGSGTDFDYVTIKYSQNPTGVDDEDETIAKEFKLHQNYPNPFNPSTTISWQSPVGSHQTLKVYDVLGREVATLADEYKEAGYHEVEFNSARLASGIYYYQLKAGSYVQTKKMIYLK